MPASSHVLHNVYLGHPDYETFVGVIDAWLNRLNEIAPQPGGESFPKYTFTLEVNPSGGKNHRIVMDTSGQRSVHAFINEDGEVLKSGGWRTPTKGARYDIKNPESAAALLRDVDWAGGYLYAGRQSYKLPKAVA